MVITSLIQLLEVSLLWPANQKILRVCECDNHGQIIIYFLTHSFIFFPTSPYIVVLAVLCFIVTLPPYPA